MMRSLLAASVVGLLFASPAPVLSDGPKKADEKKIERRVIVRKGEKNEDIDINVAPKAGEKRIAIQIRLDSDDPKALDKAREQLKKVLGEKLAQDVLKNIGNAKGAKRFRIRATDANAEDVRKKVLSAFGKNLPVLQKKPAKVVKPETKIFHLKYAVADDAGDLLAELFDGEKNAPKIVADARTNLLILRGNANALKEAGAILKMIDIPAKKK